jgi:HAD superfamily hydrolase (TIGR01549 family)
MATKNIIFDLGGVILDIDYQKTIDAFRKLGFPDFDKHYTQAKQKGLFDEFEEGRISPEAFITHLKQLFPKEVSSEQIIAAWNAMLLDWKQDKIVFLEAIQSKYKLFLFSNTNALHKAQFEKTLQEQLGLATIDPLFIKAYYSHEFGKRKPNPESFQAILDENQLLAQETLFIDDSIQHVVGAKQIGVQGLHLVDKTILDLGL